jgi:hypothetical protein
MIWFGFTESVRESWLEAGEHTYGEHCEHVIEEGWHHPFSYYTVRCRVCGRIADQDALELYGKHAQWWTPEDFVKPKKIVTERRLMDGRLVDVRLQQIVPGVE